MAVNPSPHASTSHSNMTTLHYIFDPLCGWCYAAAPLIHIAQNIPNVSIALHAGGMMTGTNKRTITPQWRDYVMPHDKRIAQLTGQPFGENYFEGLLRDTTAILDSEPPTIAILAVEDMAGKGLDMLARIQYAHYVEGRHISEFSILRDCAAQLDITAEAFAQAWSQWEGQATQHHIAESRQWLARAGGSGFPTLLLDTPGKEQITLDIGRWLGRNDSWESYLRQHTTDQSLST